MAPSDGITVQYRSRNHKTSSERLYQLEYRVQKRSEQQTKHGTRQHKAHGVDARYVILTDRKVEINPLNMC